MEKSEGLYMDASSGGGVGIGDINKDGQLDLAVGDHSRGVFIYFGNGNGIWTPAENGFIEMQADDVALIDINQDGNLDLCVGSSTTEGIGIFLGDGAGNWQKADDLGFPDTGSCHEIALGDFNGDGIVDFAASMLDQPGAWVSDGKGRWEKCSEGIPVPSWGGQYWGVAAGDVNGDGHLDLALARTVGSPEVYLGDGSGRWRPSSTGLSEMASTWGIALGDLDGDGYTDLVASGKKNKGGQGNIFGAFLFRGDGMGNWELMEDSGLPPKGLFQSWSMALFDIEGDGKLEICGCFGTAHSDRPPSFLVSDEELETKFKDVNWGPGGCVVVWKRRGHDE
jgi:hypothetical protein